MLHYIGNILDLLLPAPPERRIVNAATEADIHSLLAVQHTGSQYSLCEYARPLARSLIVAAKFQNDQRAVDHLATLLNTFLSAHQELTSTLWIPIPLSKERLRERGYNQAERVLKESDLPRACIRSDLLRRTRNTDPQTSLSHEKRHANLSGAFVVDSPKAAATLQGMNVVLFDDVTTSGATLKAAKAALSPHHPASIVCVAMAR